MAKRANNLTFEQMVKIRNACLSNAEDLITSAKNLLSIGAYHICYHLAVLALEEIGKLGLTEIQYYFAHHSYESDFNPDIEDHTKKLFWSFWAMFFRGQKITITDFESLKGFAKQIHENHLNSLYVNIDNPVEPRNILGLTDVENLIGLAESRLGYEKSFTPKKSNKRLDEVAQWFLLAAEDSEKRTFIFNDASYDKLAKLKNFYKWIKWIKSSYEKSQTELKEILEKELAREIPSNQEKTESKWKIFVSFYTESHSIRPKFISEWNKTSQAMFFEKSKNKKELKCQFLLPKQVSIHDVYDKGWIMAKVLAIALNIGTFGFFWWYIPSATQFYSERIIDLDTGVRMNFSAPDLKIEWEQRALKDESDVLSIKLILAYMVRIRGKQEEQPLDTYLTGLMLLSKSDAHLQFVSNAFEKFFVTLKSAMFINGDWKETEKLEAAVIRYLDDAITDVEELKRYLKIGQEIETYKTPKPDIKINDVASLKSYCDAYFMIRAAIVVATSVRNEK